VILDRYLVNNQNLKPFAHRFIPVTKYTGIQLECYSYSNKIECGVFRRNFLFKSNSIFLIQKRNTVRDLQKRISYANRILFLIQVEEIFYSNGLFLLE